MSLCCRQLIFTRSFWSIIAEYSSTLYPVTVPLSALPASFSSVCFHLLFDFSAMRLPFSLDMCFCERVLNESVWVRGYVGVWDWVGATVSPATTANGTNLKWQLAMRKALALALTPLFGEFLMAPKNAARKRWPFTWANKRAAAFPHNAGKRRSESEAERRAEGERERCWYR